MYERIEKFMNADTACVGPIYNERALQVELAIFFRNQKIEVQMEKPFALQASQNTSRKPKKNLDLFVNCNGVTTAIELKVPLAGRVPETMYDFVADIEFVEALVQTKQVDNGICLLVTDNRQFWLPGSSSDGIYRYFRDQGSVLSGLVSKPTGAKNTTVNISKIYQLCDSWKPLRNERLMSGAKFLLIPIIQ